MPALANFRETLGNLFKKPATISYPAEPRPPVAGARGHIAIEISDCIFCGICQRKCPTRAIAVSRPEAGWSIRRMSCIQCGACVEFCPKKCLRLAPELPAPARTQIVDEYRGTVAAPAEVKSNA